MTFILKLLHWKTMYSDPVYNQMSTTGLKKLEPRAGTPGWEICSDNVNVSINTII